MDNARIQQSASLIQTHHGEIGKFNFNFQTLHFEDLFLQKKGGGALLGYGPLLQIYGIVSSRYL